MCIVRFLITLMIGLTLISCSVGMALNGQESPDVDKISLGTPKTTVEQILGQPTGTTTKNNQTLSVYEFIIGADPSTNRAIGHALPNAMTLGIWEIYGTTSESLRRDTFNAYIAYDSDNLVRHYHVERKPN